MSLQQSVQFQTAFGIPGEFYDTSPRKVDPWMIDSPDATQNVFGRAFTNLDPTIINTARAGGTGLFAGYLVAPKDYELRGAGGNPLAPSLTVVNYTIGQLCTMGNIIVTLPAPAQLGDLVVFNQTTGVLATIAPTAAVPVGFSYGYAFVINYPISSAPSLAVISVNYVPSHP